MNLVSRIGLGTLLCLLLTSCLTVSVNPLSSPNHSKADRTLLGDWRGKDKESTLRFSLKKEPWMHLEIIAAQPEEKRETYDLYPTVIGKNTFLNVVMKGKDDQGNPTQAYIFIRYSISDKGVLQMARMSQDLIADAVRRGTLKGTVTQAKNAFMVGQPPHPDLEVSLLDSSANIVKFIEHSNLDDLFSEKMEDSYRL